jgi:hypothetical protein
MADTKPKSSKRDLWFKFGRFITGVTIACFFLPFFGVSCEGMDVVHFSGADMAGGCKPGGLITDAQKQDKEMGPGPSGGMGDIKIDNVEREPLAIVALALALVVAGLSWVRSRGAMTGAFVMSIACVGALAGLYIKVGGDLDKAIEGELGKKSAGSAIMKDTKVESGSRFGLWLSISGLLGAAALTGLALREKERAPFAPTTPPPA